jgi:nucleoside-diphosphate-sugar epimerase
VWLGKGQNKKSLIYKTDVARACLRFIESAGATKNNKTRIYNVTAQAVSMREIVAEIEKALEKRVLLPIHFPAAPLPKSLNLLGKASGIKKFGKIAETLDKWLSDDVFSGAKIETEIGFQAVVSPLEGIRREVLHYRKQK